MTPKRIVYYTAPATKRRLVRLAIEKMREGAADSGSIIKAAMADAELKGLGKEIPKLVPTLFNSLRGVDLDEASRKVDLDEVHALEAARTFLEDGFGARIEVQAGDNVTFDPAGKAKHAMPGRPAIFVE